MTIKKKHFFWNSFQKIFFFLFFFLLTQRSFSFFVKNYDSISGSTFLKEFLLNPFINYKIEIESQKGFSISFLLLITNPPNYWPETCQKKKTFSKINWKKIARREFE